MKRNIFWTILFLLTGGCTNEMIETSHHTLHIKGNEIGYFNSHSHSRLSETNETLPTGSNITFYMPMNFCSPITELPGKETPT